MANKPNIRFKGFTDDWEQRKLGEWGEFYYGRSCPKWSVTEDAITPCVRYGELYTKFGSKIDEIYSYTNMPVDNLRFSKGNEVLIPRVGEDPMDYNHCTWLSIPGVAIGEMISVFNTTQSPLFSAIMFNATLQREFAMRVEGGSVTNLYYDKLKNIDVLYPTMEEQKEIARYFSTIDHLITLHQRKCDETKKLKKFMLQKMFPKNGEKNPEIRFAGFTDDWEQRKLGEDLESIQTGTNLLGSENNNGMPLLKMGNIQRGYFDTSKLEYLVDNKSVEPENVAYYGDFFFNTRNTMELVGKGATWTGESGKYAFNSNIARFKLKGIDTIFFNFLYNTDSMAKQVHARAMGTTSVAAIYPRSLDSIDYCLPCIDEQKRIGDYFRNLDHLITLHQRKCDKLKLIKKFMLQNMFPKKG